MSWVISVGTTPTPYRVSRQLSRIIAFRVWPLATYAVGASVLPLTGELVIPKPKMPELGQLIELSWDQPSQHIVVQIQPSKLRQIAKRGWNGPYDDPVKQLESS